VPNKNQENPFADNPFVWVPITLHAGRGAVRGPAAARLQEVFSLRPDEAKWVPVNIGIHKQLYVLPETGRLLGNRSNLKVDQIDWEVVAKSEAARDALRLLAVPKEVRMIDSAGIVRLSFPDDLLKLNLLDETREVVVLIAGRFVEFWSGERWRAFLENSATNQEIILEAIDALKR
jgi:DNA-binding transcriptional regulator/RsmH inhibitor MraZ